MELYLKDTYTNKKKRVRQSAERFFYLSAIALFSLHSEPSCLVLKTPYALASKNPLPAVELRMIDFVEETPPLRRQRVEHFRREIGLWCRTLM